MELIRLNVLSFILALAISIFGIHALHAAQPPGIPGVTGGPFGNSTQVGRFTVKDGKVVSASNVNIAFPTSLPPSGAASGDLTGTYPNPSIGVGAVSATKLADGAVTFSKINADNADSASAGQVLTTDGLGGLTWASSSSSQALAAKRDNTVSLSFGSEDIVGIDQLPPGQYVVMAKLRAGATHQTTVSCDVGELEENSFRSFDNGKIQIPAPIPPAVNTEMVMSLLALIEDPANIHVSCSSASSAFVGTAKVVALKVDLTLTDQTETD